MKAQHIFNDRVQAVTVDIRPAGRRMGTTHTYVLNGTLLRDVLLDGRWVTFGVSAPPVPCGQQGCF
ncbi:hypothetical protein [Paraburkholderia kururiensis]|uniref:hypothetical protein n=1 Tax=Paraburkholderia kururiensis TaxID=984307 RepID=UPI0005AACA6F|nr:hypothetical protein [Paraburkholderia kururiensis]